MATLLALGSEQGWAAIAFDAASTGTQAPPGNVATWSHTCTGSNLALFVEASCPNTTTASGITYAGFSLAKSTATEAGTAGTSGDISMWFLANPATGANNIIVTCTGALGAGGAAESLTGVNQTTVIESSNAASGFGSTASKNITTITNNDWVVSGIGGVIGADWTGTSITRRAGAQGSVLDEFIGDVGPKTPAGAQTASWATSPVLSKAWGMVNVAVVAAVGGITSTPQRTLTGVGL